MTKWNQFRTKREKIGFPLLFKDNFATFSGKLIIKHTQTHLPLSIQNVMPSSSELTCESARPVYV